MTYYVLSGMLNPTHSLIYSLCTESNNTSLLLHLLTAVPGTILLHITNITCPTTWWHVGYLVTIDREFSDVTAPYLYMGYRKFNYCRVMNIYHTSYGKFTPVIHTKFYQNGRVLWNLCQKAFFSVHSVYFECLE